MQTALLAVVLLPLSAVAAEPQDAVPPLAWYTFEAGAGASVVDRSGHGYDGVLVGGKRVPNGAGTALRFETQGEYAECARDRGFGLRDRVSLEAWVCPEAVPTSGEPGIVGQGYASFVLTYYTDGQCWWYIGGGGNNCHAPLSLGLWQHLVGTFDGSQLRLYVDGVLSASNVSKTPTIPEGNGLFLGRQASSGQESHYSQGKTFIGRIAAVRLYDRELSAEEVRRCYRTSNLTRTVDLAVFPLYFGGQLGVELNLRGLGERPADTCVSLELWRAGEAKPVRALVTQPLGPGDRAETVLRVDDLEPGEYELRGTPTTAQGQALGLSTSKPLTWPRRPAWPNAPSAVKVLNNLVSELLGVDVGAAGEAVHTFTNPREGWVLVVIPAGAAVALDGAALSGPEAQRWLPAGEHQLTVRTEAGGAGPPRRVSVRAVPTLGYSQFQANPHVAPFGPYDWAFLQKHVLPHCNLIMAGGAPEYKPYLEEWKKRDGKWVVHAGVPGLDGKPVTADAVEKAWTANLGWTEPLADGIIVDEFGAGDQPQYAVWTEAVQRLTANPSAKGKLFIPYTGGAMYAAKGSGAFIRAVLDRGFPFANERYLPEQPTEAAARRYLDTALRVDAEGWNRGTPEGVRRMLVTLGYLAAPNESLDRDPGVDWCVYMDMQMQLLATDPAFFGLWGIKWYLSSYADEEQVRLGARLFRHYAIEGRTDRLLQDPYVLTHLQNPDFADGLNGWTVSAAEPERVTPGQMAGFSWLEGRYPQTSQGDAFAVLKRSAARPNSLSQVVRHLEPGRLYALRLFAADWKDLGTRKDLALSVALDGVETMPGKSFVFVIRSCYAHTLGDFNAQHPAWFSYVFRVFRPTGTESRITISDWSTPEQSGGPVDQELAVNFVQIQPYRSE